MAQTGRRAELGLVDARRLLDLAVAFADELAAIGEYLLIAPLVAVDEQALDAAVVLLRILRVEGDEWCGHDVLQLQALHLRILVLYLSEVPEDEATQAVALRSLLGVVDRAHFDFVAEDERAAAQVVDAAAPRGRAFLERHFSSLSLSLLGSLSITSTQCLHNNNNNNTFT